MNNLVEQDHRRVKQRAYQMARIQEIQEREDRDQRHKASAEAQERSVRYFGSNR